MSAVIVFSGIMYCGTVYCGTVYCGIVSAVVFSGEVHAFQIYEMHNNPVIHMDCLVFYHYALWCRVAYYYIKYI